LQPVRSVNVTGEHGSLVWAERKDGFWWACFANYDAPVGAPGRDHRHTIFAKLDDRFRLVNSWRFPSQVLAAFKPWSCSGGSWGDDGLLYATGHDAKMLYVLRLPKSGPALESVTTIEVPFEGQAWAWDRSQERGIYAISRPRSEVVVVRLPEMPAELMER
jgi:dipeptidyl aminopeptidase/acylaminoacyl peptidase